MPMTQQEAFDRVVQGVRAQNYVQSLIDDDSCAYRGEGGTRCHAGHLIPDRLYDPSWEGESIGGLLAHVPELQEHFEGLSDRFLRSLQSLHDMPQLTLAGSRNVEAEFEPNGTSSAIGGFRYSSPEAYERALAAFAAYWQLVYTPPQAKA